MKLRYFFFVMCSVAFVSCKGNKLAGDAANPYDAAANGGYSSGDFFNAPETAAPTPAPVDYSAAYDPAYTAAMNAHDSGGEHASVIPFTDNGSGYTHQPSPPPVSRPQVAASTPPKKTVASTSKPKTTTSSSKPKTVASSTKKKTTTAKPAPKIASNSKSSSTKKATAGTKGGKAIPAVYKPEKKIASSKSTSTKKKASVTRVYTVKKGDNLSKIAARAGTTVSALKAKNKLKKDVIIPGQELTL